MYRKKKAKESEAPVISKQKFTSNDLNASAIRAYKFNIMDMANVCTLKCNTQEWEEQMRLKCTVLGYTFWSKQQLNGKFIVMLIV